jgi:hypothetical protein
MKKLTKIQEKLKDFFETKDFNVHIFEQDKQICAEVETWTDGGVNMIITLMPFNKQRFIDYVDNFSVDEEIELHRQGKDYCNAFTIRESLTDFETFLERLENVKNEL